MQDAIVPDPNSSSSTPSSSTSNDTIQTFEFSQKTYDALNELAHGREIAETLRDAIAISKWFNDTLTSGAKILVERNGKLYQVIKR